MFQVNMYAIQNKSCFPIDLEDARALNEKRAEIYWTPNNFIEFGKRKKTELTEITTFFCEIDDDTKEKQEFLISLGPTPSCVIETKRGFQIYWYLKEPVDCRKDPEKYSDRFRSFVVDRIVPVYGADANAADACRLLRLPFYKYWKDGLGEFHIDIAFESPCFYTVDQIQKYFPERKTHTATSMKTHPTAQKPQGDDFWTKAGNLPCKAALTQLSGSQAVMSEVFSFKPTKDGGFRIIIDGKPRNTWIDKNGKIGSTDGGGPSVSNWLFYYHKDWKKVAELLKQYFPEIV